jgi:hypothetical protein
MSRSSALGDVEADLLALRSAAERAGTALACLFSSSDEVEAVVIVTRRGQGTRGSRRRRMRRVVWSALGTLALALAFLML